MKSSKIRKIILPVLLVGTMNLYANEDISYDWGEINFEGRKAGSYATGDALTLASSFAISDSFYIRGDVSRAKHDTLSIYENAFALGLGFHKSIDANTDFYTELSYLNNDPKGFKIAQGFEFTVGSRTIFSSTFELITAIGYKDMDLDDRPNYLQLRNSEGGFNFGLTGLYKLGAHSSIHFGVKHEDSVFSPLVGYRWNW